MLLLILIGLAVLLLLILPRQCFRLMVRFALSLGVVAEEERDRYR